MKRVYLTIGMVLLIAFLPVLAVAQRGGVEGGRGHRPMSPHRMYRGGRGSRAGPIVGMLLRLKEKLGLSAEQVEQLEAIKDEVRGQFKDGAKAVRAKRVALQEAVKSGATEPVICAAAGELGNAIGDNAVLRVSTKAKVDGVLTDAQKAKLEELKERRAERSKEQRSKCKRRMGRGREGRRGPGRVRYPDSAFARIDTDVDGAISLEEFKSHMEQMKERHRGKGPRGRRGPRSEGPVEELED